MTSIHPSATFELAHPGKRFQGQFLDALFAYIFGIIAFYLSDPLVGRDYAVYFGGAVATVYFLFSDGLPNGQSFGKKLINIQVIHKETNEPCSMLQSFLRNITFPLGIMDWVFIFFGSHRRIGDFLAGTVVIKNAKPV